VLVAGGEVEVTKKGGVSASISRAGDLSSLIVDAEMIVPAVERPELAHGKHSHLTLKHFAN
jgi:hypothetical protein